MSLWSRCVDWVRLRNEHRRPIRTRRPASRYTLCLEPLEDRCVPAISLSSTPGAAIALGSGVPLTDSATLSGGVNPTGYILFELNAPGGNLVAERIAAVTGNGTYSTPSGYLPSGTGTLTGTYQWSASYSGDMANSPAQAIPVSEDVTPAITTLTATAGGKLALGSGTLTDSATLSGGVNATGTITFTLADANSNTVDTETATVNGNGTYTTPTGYAPTAPGTYQWSASYGGDSNNSMASAAGTQAETVDPAAPAVTVTPAAAVLVGSGTMMTASAMLANGYNPTGAILFTLTAPDGTIVDSEIVTVNGNGTYSTPNGFLPGTTGTYQWQASYSGDANNTGITSQTAPENAQTGPSLTTTPGGTVVLGSGSALTDTATLTGGINPTGTITFTLLDPNGKTVDTETATVNGNGTYSTPTGCVPSGTGTLTGTYEWSASYGGDSNNAGASSAAGAEPETVSAASPVLTGTPGGAVVLGSGVALTDSVTLAGGFNATGTITFTLADPSGIPVDTETANVSGDGTYSTPTDYIPSGTGTLTGTYEWTASYSGDGNNNPFTTAPGSQPEDVTAATPNLTTTPGGTVVVGTSVAMTDSATLAGAVNAGGSITFTLTAPDGTTIADTETVSVTGNGTYTTPTGYLPTAAGTYQWTASYSGDSNNTAVNSPAGAAPEIAQASPTLTTMPGSAVALAAGAMLTDTATLTGGFNASGTITFTLVDPNGHTVDTETASVNGNGTYGTPAGYALPATGAAPGTYQWNASYSGDTYNTAVSHTNDAAEQVTVSLASPALTTTASSDLTLTTTAPTLSDSAVLAGGYNPTGKIVFTLSGPNGLSYTQSDTVAGNGTYTAGGTLPTTGAVTGIYTWSAAYDGDVDNNPFTETGSAANGEQTVVSPAGPTLTAAPPAASITLGAATVTLQDTATLSASYFPTGTITFTLIAPGGATVDIETVAVNGNGNYTTATGFTLPANFAVTGTFQWNVSYAGDANNNAAHDVNDPGEQVAVLVATPSITGTPSAATVMPSVSTLPLTDTAIISGGYNPTGTLTFTLVDPNGVTVNSETVAVNGNGSYTTPTGYTLPSTGNILGTYQWNVAYSGDGNNNPVSDDNAPGEQVAVRIASPTVTNTPGGTVTLGTGARLTDSATLAGGIIPTGYILFSLTAPGGSIVDREIVLVNGDGTYTTPTGYLPRATGTYQWTASYSGDSDNIAASAGQRDGESRQYPRDVRHARPHRGGRQCGQADRRRAAREPRRPQRLGHVLPVRARRAAQRHRQQQHLQRHRGRLRQRHVQHRARQSCRRLSSHRRRHADRPLPLGDRLQRRPQQQPRNQSGDPREGHRRHPHAYVEVRCRRGRRRHRPAQRLGHAERRLRAEWLLAVHAGRARRQRREYPGCPRRRPRHVHDAQWLSAHHGRHVYMDGQLLGRRQQQRGHGDEHGGGEPRDADAPARQQLGPGQQQGHYAGRRGDVGERRQSDRNHHVLPLRAGHDRQPPRHRQRLSRHCHGQRRRHLRHAGRRLHGDPDRHVPLGSRLQRRHR